MQLRYITMNDLSNDWWVLLKNRGNTDMKTILRGRSAYEALKEVKRTDDCKRREEEGITGIGDYTKDDRVSPAVNE